MSKTVVIAHSGYGHTKVVAQHVAKGAEAQLIEISPEGDITEADWAALAAADAIIMGAPTYMGNVSWQFKKFADASSKVWFTLGWKDKVFGGFTNSASPSGDKQVALASLQTLASQHGGIWVSLGLAPSNAKAATSADINHLGGSVGLMTRSPSDAGVDEVPAGDLETAVLYGQRVAQIAARFSA